MTQGEAHLLLGHSKVTVPPGFLWVRRAPTTSGVVGYVPAACTHFLCPPW